MSQDPTYFDVVRGGYTLDFWAFGLVLALSVLLCWGIRETKTVNNIITVVHVGVVIFIIIAGLTQSKVPALGRAYPGVPKLDCVFCSRASL